VHNHAKARRQEEYDKDDAAKGDWTGEICDWWSHFEEVKRTRSRPAKISKSRKDLLKLLFTLYCMHDEMLCARLAKNSGGVECYALCC
jgi:hypothetical protein